MKPTFWEYLKINHFWILAGFTGLMLWFWAYWIATTGWDRSIGDIIVSGLIFLIIWTAWIGGSYITWRKL